MIADAAYDELAVVLITEAERFERDQPESAPDQEAAL
jgi:hypothetical protein